MGVTNTQLLLRQLRDIQIQADKIVRGEDSSEAIENFANYSKELQNYILSRTDNLILHPYAGDLQEIRYRRMQFQLWHLLALPLWFALWYKDQVQRKALVNQIGALMSKFARMEMLVKQQIQ